jgi:hypothetical protein
MQSQFYLISCLILLFNYISLIPAKHFSECRWKFIFCKKVITPSNMGMTQNQNISNTIMDCCSARSLQCHTFSVLYRACFSQPASPVLLSRCFAPHSQRACDAGVQPIHAICIGWKHILIPSQCIYMRHYSRESSLVTPWWLGRKWDCAPLLLHQLCNPLSAGIFPREVLQVPALWLCIAAFSFNHIGRISHAALRVILQRRASVESNIFVFSNFSAAAFLTVMFCGINRAENCVLHKSERGISNHQTDWIFSQTRACVCEGSSLSSSFMVVHISPSGSPLKLKLDSQQTQQKTQVLRGSTTLQSLFSALTQFQS